MSIPVRRSPCRIAITIILSCLSAAVSADPDCASHTSEHAPGSDLNSGDEYMGLRLLGSLELHETQCKSLPLMGLSALAWSADTQILYALSDRGHVLHLRPVIHANRLTDVRVVDAFPLRGPDDQPLDTHNGDSEGMTVLNGANGISGDEQLLVSFERRPRVSRYRTYGLWLEDMPLPARLTEIDNYRTPNQALEGVVMHPQLGLLTAPERPVADTRQSHFRIYDRNGPVAELARADADYGSLTDIALTPDGRLLALERIFSGAFGIIAAVIHRLDPAGADTGSTRVETIARLDRDAGHNIDNFEGLTHHRDNRYFMISDNNGFFVQKTLLLYFELVD
ncbi:hypothetical protein J2T55_000719 [Methylohalomonas lacus]|uniref:Phytase-like domain-containing protein n=1 Tax=Methylohalomonas lacus TaxID=398773 RepID=A0AAE3HI15_9GAMM|nr:esterase-like activity of phytase family protein [Methylohalomonas lacus]MCS3902715.1 hypothetical protein [Methylohalomonas lacus]